ncbi:hypothetical protein BS78_01G245000 [Paspalum vaginatum]|nr:hypothetical protein BS78_01G245000 [Paspalum vaginatum]
MDVGSSDLAFYSIFPSCVVLDNDVCRKELASFRDDDPTSAVARASNGELVRVSFILRALPDASRLCIYIDYKGLAASHDAIDYFIYQASPSGPRLSLIPRHFPTECEIETAEVGSWRRNPRTGLLTVDRGDFVVAELHLDLERLDDVDTPLEGQLFRLCYSDRYTGAGEWEVKHTRACGGKAKFCDLLCWWEAHVVVPYGSYLCWVDYSRGIIFCDVNHSSPDLQYLPLPVDHIPVGYPDPYRIGWPQASRAVCITKGGTMKFINIARSDGMLSDESEPGSGFTITISTLLHRGYDDVWWRKDVAIEADQLWDMEGYHNQLPRIVPQFPLLSIDNPNIIYFVLKKNYTVDAGERAGVLWYKYVKGTSSDDTSEMTPCNIFCSLPFFPTEFSKPFLKATPR